MLKQILQIVPTLSSGDLNNMEKALNGRFTKIAKRFGKGLVGALTGGGIAGLALGVIDKLLNPLKEVQESIDRVLHQGDDIVTNAKQFGTTAGKLFKLQQIGKATGLDADSLNNLIVKFQGAVAEATANPTKQTSVRQFVGEKDTAESFFQFIQALQKLDGTQQTLVQQEVFGEKQILKMADFLRSDFGEILKTSGLDKVQSGTLTQAAEKAGSLNDLQDTLRAGQEAKDFVAKSNLLNEDIVRQRSASEQLNLDRENQRIAQFDSLVKISDASTQITALAEQGLTAVATIVTKLTGITDTISKFTGSRLLKGIIGEKKDK